MEINVDLTREDYIDFNKYFFLKKGLKKRIYIVIIIALMIPLIVDYGQPFEIFTYLKTAVLAGFIFGLIYFGGMMITIKRTGKLPSDNGSLLGKKKFIITDEGLVEDCESNRNLQKWKGIKSIETNDNSIFIFIDTLVAYVIPKRSFKDEAEIENFIKIIQEKIKAT
uniref:YcxB family protein n=1 Tax=uncultured Draconibacterium sp. TaxID=1573823 RepID=UPI0032174246